MEPRELAKQIDLINERFMDVQREIASALELAKSFKTTLDGLKAALAEEKPEKAVYEWVQIADVLPQEGETVFARWPNGTVNWTYYRKSAEYPGAFCFYDQLGQAITAPKEWRSLKQDEAV